MQSACFHRNRQKWVEGFISECQKVLAFAEYRRFSGIEKQDDYAKKNAVFRERREGVRDTTAFGSGENRKPERIRFGGGAGLGVTRRATAPP